jgi:hypothetical protein
MKKFGRYTSTWDGKYTQCPQRASLEMFLRGLWEQYSCYTSAKKPVARAIHCCEETNGRLRILKLCSIVHVHLVQPQLEAPPSSEGTGHMNDHIALLSSSLSLYVMKIRDLDSHNSQTDSRGMMFSWRNVAAKHNFHLQSAIHLSWC